MSDKYILFQTDFADFAFESQFYSCSTLPSTRKYLISHIHVSLNYSLLGHFNTVTCMHKYFFRGFV